ncbi:MAG TPA: GxxExxY protein [Bacteroidota bacterium]|nr:GxxExxY protein [Bacteroidota bacterium]
MITRGKEVMGGLLYGELTARIIGAAYTVHNTLGANLTEATYKNALIVQLRLMDMAVEVEKEIPLSFAKVDVGIQRVDILVEGKIIIEAKAIRKISNDHLKKLLATLRNSGHQLGLIINFGASVHVKRVINTIQNK